MLKISAFSVDTSRQTTPSLVDGVVHAVVHTLHALFCTFFSRFGSAKIIEIC